VAEKGEEMKISRLLTYEGDENWILSTLTHRDALDKKFSCIKGTITETFVYDENDPFMIKIRKGRKEKK